MNIGEEVDALLYWCGTDVDRLHMVYAAERAQPQQQARAVLLRHLRDRLGWPAPDTPVAEVLRSAGTPGLPVAAILHIEEGRPPQYQRPALVEILRARAAALGDRAHERTPTTQR